MYINFSLLLDSMLLSFLLKFQSVISGKWQGSVHATGTPIQLKAALTKDYCLFPDFLTYLLLYLLLNLSCSMEIQYCFPTSDTLYSAVIIVLLSRFGLGLIFSVILISSLLSALKVSSIQMLAMCRKQNMLILCNILNPLLFVSGCKICLYRNGNKAQQLNCIVD